MTSDSYYRVFHHEREHVIRELAAGPRTLKYERPGFRKFSYPDDVASAMIAEIPGGREFGLVPKFVQLFVTSPGYYYRPHKDGGSLRMGINYVLSTGSVNDCRTSWYAEATMSDAPRVNLKRGDLVVSRELELNTPGLREPACTRTFCVEDGAILFNTDVYHDFNMGASESDRYLLTFRSDTGCDYGRALAILTKFGLLR